MRIEINLSALDSAVERMGGVVRDVPLGEFVLDDISPISIELVRGIDIELKDIEVNQGGLLGYQGHQVVLYIPDQGWRIEDVFDDGAQGKKVHVANCITLDEMKRRGRFERYVVRNGLSPKFLVTGKTREGNEIEGDAELRVCMNCMKFLNFKNFNNKKGFARKAIVNDFSLDNFFATYSSYFKHMPLRRAEESATNRYSANWKDLSKRYRENIKWKCEECSVDLSKTGHRRLLHVHHINGVKGDDGASNLKGVCIDCHSKEEMHQHLFVSHGDRRIIQSLRKAQEIYRAAPQNSTDVTDWTEARMNADPAVHGLLFELEAQGYSVPEVGQDVCDPKTHRVIYSNAELVWPELTEVVVLEADSDCEALERKGWTVFTAQGLLDTLVSR